jgi:hypothetical protein
VLSGGTAQSVDMGIKGEVCAISYLGWLWALHRGQIVQKQDSSQATYWPITTLKWVKCANCIGKGFTLHVRPRLIANTPGLLAAITRHDRRKGLSVEVGVEYLNPVSRESWNATALTGRTASCWSEIAVAWPGAEAEVRHQAAPQGSTTASTASAPNTLGSSLSTAAVCRPTASISSSEAASATHCLASGPRSSLLLRSSPAEHMAVVASVDM